MKECKLHRMIPEKLHPGEFLKDELKARKISMRTFDDMVNYINFTKNVIGGYHDITLVDSARIGKALGVDLFFFFRLQVEHDRYKLKEKYDIDMDNCPICEAL